MANIILDGTTLNNVTYLDVPKVGGGTARFSEGGGGGNYQTKSKTYTPTESQQTESVTADAGYDALSTVTVKVNAVSSTYVGSGITRKAAATYTPGTSDQTIASGTYLTGTQTIAGDSNLVAGNIKKDIQIFNVTGTYEASGGSYPDGDNEGWGTPSSSYSVTITLTNPSNPTEFSSGDVTSANGTAMGDEIETIYTITSPTESGTFTVDPSVPYIWVGLSGSYPGPDYATVTATGEITYEGINSLGAFMFALSGSGTITIDGMEYYDD